MKKISMLSAAAAALLCVLSTGRADADDDNEGEAAFYGTVEAMPQGGVQGKWVVNGREIVVTPRTEIEQKHAAAAVGSYVKVEGVFSGSSFIVYELEVERGAADQRRAAGGNCRLAGTVEKMPENNYEGIWIVGGRQIHVGSETVIDETSAKASAGVRAEIKGIRSGQAVKALEIRIADKGSF